MRLIHVETLHLREFIGNIPPYAILSHTWGDDEVLFADLQEGDSSRAREKKEAFSKIQNCCNVAAADGFEWAWIDTCCIDKTSSAELSEAINSMFAWYYKSDICYAFLSDVEGRRMHIPNSYKNHQSAYHLAVSEQDLDSCRWFTRGWTLQELLAPEHIIFFDRHWREIGSKRLLAGQISRVTRIPIEALTQRSWDDYGVAQKFSWAATRCTTRIEDASYSLLGLFGINMPLLYGEGGNAFRRLQEEILQWTNDQSIFAWIPSSPEHDYYIQSGYSGLLADSLSMFRHSSEFYSINDTRNDLERHDEYHQDSKFGEFLQFYKRMFEDDFINTSELRRNKLRLGQLSIGPFRFLRTVSQDDVYAPVTVDEIRKENPSLLGIEGLKKRHEGTPDPDGVEIVQTAPGKTMTTFRGEAFLLHLPCTYRNSPLCLVLSARTQHNGGNMRMHMPSLACLHPSALDFLPSVGLSEGATINAYTRSNMAGTSKEKVTEAESSRKNMPSVCVKNLVAAGYVFAYRAPSKWTYDAEACMFSCNAESTDDSSGDTSQVVLFAHDKEVKEHVGKFKKPWEYLNWSHEIMDRLAGRDDMGGKAAMPDGKTTLKDSVDNIVFEILMSREGLGVIAHPQIWTAIDYRELHNIQVNIDFQNMNHVEVSAARGQAVILRERYKGSETYIDLSLEQTMR